MRKITFGEPVLKIEGLETKFDVVPVSNSLAILIGDRDLATIVQQLSYWTLQGYGEVIDGVRWFYKPIAEWIEEVFPTFTPWKLGKMMKQLSARGIIRREKLFTKHQIQKGDRFWWQPKNQTYYYSLNTDKLQELADNFQILQTSQTSETSVSIKTQILSNEEIEDTKDFDCTKNNTKNTSKEYNSKDYTHPTLPSECESKNSINQDKDSLNTGKLSSNLKATKDVVSRQKAIEKETNYAHVEKKVNQNISTTLDVESVPKPKLKTSSVTKQKRRKKAPWKDEEQFKQFYRELIKALPIVANAHSPQGLAQTIIRQLRCGIPHSYWDDFEAGLPIGTSTKPEWEITPGEPYPMFVEYLTEKLKAGNNSTSEEQTRNEVFSILCKPRQAKAFWGQFKRSVVNVSQRIESDRALGVSNPNTPVWTRERIEPTISEAATAGEKIMTVNGSASTAIAAVKTPQLEQSPQSNDSRLDSSSPDKNEEISDPWTDEEEGSSACESSTKPTEPAPTLRELLTQKLGNRNLKGFVKAMPKVPTSEVRDEERRAMKPKTNISSMSIGEINNYLSDPILRKQIMPQLWHSSYRLITDELGEVIAVTASVEEEQT